MFNNIKNYFQSDVNLGGQAFRERFEAAPNKQLIDVRTPAEFAAASLPGAINLPLGSERFQQALEQLDPAGAYFVYCRSGSRSGSACQVMGTRGLKAYNLAGGIGAWPKG